MNKKTYAPEGAVIVGPYSPAVEAGDFIFFSGQIPVRPGECELVEGDIKIQAKQCLQNLSSVLEAAGITQNEIVKTTIYMSDMNDYIAVNEVYAQYFSSPYPARTAIGVASLPLGAKIEIEAIAKKK